MARGPWPHTPRAWGDDTGLTPFPEGSVVAQIDTTNIPFAPHQGMSPTQAVYPGPGQGSNGGRGPITIDGTTYPAVPTARQSPLGTFNDDTGLFTPSWQSAARGSSSSADLAQVLARMGPRRPRWGAAPGAAIERGSNSPVPLARAMGSLGPNVRYHRGDDTSGGA